MKPRNIILIHADQHRSDCIGCYGNVDVKTPHIDALSQDGTRYTNSFTVYPICTPARYSMFSGMYTHQHGAWTNIATLPSGYKTFTGELRRHGFHTAGVGKMHFTPTYQKVGFDSLSLAEQNGIGRYEDDYHTFLMGQDRIDLVDLTDQVDEIRQNVGSDYQDCFGAVESDLPKELHSTTWTTIRALSEISSWDENSNNFLMIGYIKPHHPFDPPAPYSEMYDPSALTVLEGYCDQVPPHDYQNGAGFFDNATLTEERLRKVMAYYYGSITQIDDDIGEIIALLKSRGLYDDAMIIYTSDHGEYMGYHHMLLKCNYLYEALARIPLIIKYPHGKMDVSDKLCETIDLATTILSCCELSIPTSMEGIDLASKDNGRQFAFSEGQYGTETDPRLGYMIRTKQYKLLCTGSLDDCMFFDLQADPTEMVNEADNPTYAKAVAEHKSMLINKLLFKSGGKNHCDFDASQLCDKNNLEEVSKGMKAFIDAKLNPL